MPGTPGAVPPVPPPPRAARERRILDPAGAERRRPPSPEGGAPRVPTLMHDSVATAPAGPYTQRISYAFAKAQGVLALGDEGGAIVVLTRPDATVEGLAELKRVLQRPLATRAGRRRALRRRARPRLQRRGRRVSRSCRRTFRARPISRG